MLANTISEAIRAVDSMPGEIEMKRVLPSITHQTKVTIIGELNQGTQIISILVESQERVERILMLSQKVNGGEFSIIQESPSTIRLSKTDWIQLELI